MLYSYSPFKGLSKEEMKRLYEDRKQAQEQGLRPRSFDPFIKEVQNNFMMSFGDAWRYTDTVFLEEIAQKYFA